VDSCPWFVVAELDCLSGDCALCCDDSKRIVGRLGSWEICQVSMMKKPDLVKGERELGYRIRNARHLELEDWQLFDELQKLKMRGLSEESYQKFLWEIDGYRNRAYPFVSRLIRRILAHRHTCKAWKKQEPCFDCHWGLLGRIEQELTPTGVYPFDKYAGDESLKNKKCQNKS
jgi:hypothetical protein